LRYQELIPSFKGVPERLGDGFRMGAGLPDG